MENLQEAKQAIADSKNICLVPAKSPEALTSTLALFYTLKDLGKNVNLIIDELPENLKFLSPSLDFISYPKNFVISIPTNKAKITQVYYEKNEDALKVHLTLENGMIKKEDLSLYYSETKPDLVATLGINDYQKELQSKLDSFGFLLDSPILNIDSDEQNNKKFGKINLVESRPLLESVMHLINKLH